MDQLNEYLQPGSAPVTTHEGESGFSFDTTSDRSMIGAYQIRNASIGSAKIGTAAIGSANIQDAAIGSAQVGTISFNQISGGTAILGGTSNGNGMLSVKDTGGTEIIRLDNTGINIPGTRALFLSDNSSIRWGDGNSLIFSAPGTPGTFLIDALDKNFRLETDSGTIHLYTSKEVKITMGTGSLLKVVKSTGGTLMTLDGSSGNLRILGTLEENATF